MYVKSKKVSTTVVLVVIMMSLLAMAFVIPQASAETAPPVGTPIKEYKDSVQNISIEITGNNSWWPWVDHLKVVISNAQPSDVIKVSATFYTGNSSGIEQSGAISELTFTGLNSYSQSMDANYYGIAVAKVIITVNSAPSMTKWIDIDYK